MREAIKPPTLRCGGNNIGTIEIALEFGNTIGCIEIPCDDEFLVFVLLFASFLNVGVESVSLFVSTSTVCRRINVDYTKIETVNF